MKTQNPTEEKKVARRFNEAYTEIVRAEKALVELYSELYRQRQTRKAQAVHAQLENIRQAQREIERMFL